MIDTETGTNVSWCTPELSINLKYHGNLMIQSRL